MGLNYEDHIKESHYKQGIEKINWGSKPFTHWFGLGNMALHINANKLQDYICQHIKDKVNIIGISLSMLKPINGINSLIGIPI